MRKFSLAMQVLAVILLVGAILLFGIAADALKHVGTSDFDVSKWEDVDFFALRSGFQLLIASLISNALSFLIRLKR